MAVHGEDDVFCAFRGFDQIFDQRPHLFRGGVANRIRDIDRCRTVFDRCFHDLGKKFRLASRRVLRRELDIRAVLLCVCRHTAGCFQHVLRFHLQFVFHMQRGRCDEQMDPRIHCIFYGIPCRINVALCRSGQRCNGASLDLPRDRLHGFKISRRRDGKAGLDDIDFHPFQALCDLDLFTEIHAAPR